ncbi:hypothetical protein M3J09_011172 [Ascochyta lentis]
MYICLFPTNRSSNKQVLHHATFGPVRGSPSRPRRHCSAASASLPPSDSLLVNPSAPAVTQQAATLGTASPPAPRISALGRDPARLVPALARERVMRSPASPSPLIDER